MAKGEAVKLPDTFTVAESDVEIVRSGVGREASAAFQALAKIVAKAAGDTIGKTWSIPQKGEREQAAVLRHLRRAASENHGLGMRVAQDAKNVYFKLGAKRARNATPAA